jgi:hypothetical protein
MKRFSTIVLLVLLVMLAAPAKAQETNEVLRLSVQKDFGFSMGGRIQGRFTIRVSGPENLARVAFLIDGQVMGVAEKAPFRYSFSTGDYALGAHRISAVGLTVLGDEIVAEEQVYEFIDAEQAWRTALGLVGPILGGIFALLLGIGLSTMFLGRRRRVWQPGVYSVAGGAICPRCALPYSRHFLSPNLFFGKLERCPHCGKWAIVRRAPLEELAVAEAKLKEDGQRGGLKFENEEDHLKRLVDDSRFER